MATIDQEFLALVERHQGILHKVCRSYADNEADRRDLMQEILYQLWRSYRGYDGRASFSTWMYRIAVNTAISGLRKLRAMVATDPLDERLAAPNVVHDELLERLHAAIRQLEPVQRAMVIMFLDGLSYREIAAALGATENAIGVRMHRVRARLSELLGEGR